MLNGRICHVSLVEGHSICDGCTMEEQKSQATLLLLMAMLAFWAAAWGYSFVFVFLAEAQGDGFTRGLNRITGFLGWQGVAGMFAFACWGIGRGFPTNSGIRRTSALPLGLVLALVVVVLARISWSWISQF
ncbi:MAG: hypothetical protein KUG69_10300 [Marinosulfonomonas sp.]|nr:hypothetical protein [Marinosulfonomonas sp.]